MSEEPKFERAEAQSLLHSALRYITETIGEELNQRLRTICEDHCGRTGAISLGYQRGTFAYWVGPRFPMVKNIFEISPQTRGQFYMLAPELETVHAEWKLEHDRFIEDKRIVSQTINSMVQRAGSWQDIRNMFPDLVLQPLLDREDLHLSTLPRTSVPAYAGSPSADDHAAQRAAAVDVWGPQLVDLYGRMAPLVALHIGMKLL